MALKLIMRLTFYAVNLTKIYDKVKKKELLSILLIKILNPF